MDLKGEILSIKIVKSSWTGNTLTGHRVYQIKTRISDKKNQVYYVKRRFTDFKELAEILTAYNLNDVISPLPEKTV